MKKIFLIILAISFLFVSTSCTKTQNKNVVIEIRERMFLGQVNDIYKNAQDYLGRKIKLEGIFLKDQYTTGETFYSVIRYGPGCCGDDDQAGFEVAWPDNDRQAYPEDGSWVEVMGELKRNRMWLYIELSSIIVKLDRGLEFVTQ